MIWGGGRMSGRTVSSDEGGLNTQLLIVFARCLVIYKGFPSLRKATVIAEGRNVHDERVRLDCVCVAVDYILTCLYERELLCRRPNGSARGDAAAGN